jgi:hypothetical protein
MSSSTLKELNHGGRGAAVMQLFQSWEIICIATQGSLAGSATLGWTIQSFQD